MPLPSTNNGDFSFFLSLPISSLPVQYLSSLHFEWRRERKRRPDGNKNEDEQCKIPSLFRDKTLEINSKKLMQSIKTIKIKQHKNRHANLWIPCNSIEKNKESEECPLLLPLQFRRRRLSDPFFPVSGQVPPLHHVCSSSSSVSLTLLDHSMWGCRMHGGRRRGRRSLESSVTGERKEKYRRVGLKSAKFPNTSRLFRTKASQFLVGN